MKVQVAGLLLLIGLPSIAAALQQGTEAEIRARNCALRGVETHGPIITGTIAEVRLAPSDTPLTDRNTGSATISIDRYLRGPHFPAGSVTLPVDWTTGPRTFLHGSFQPIWSEVTLQPGERLLLMLFSMTNLEPAGNPNDFRATCVLDLNSVSAVLPTIERMVRLDATEGSTKIEAMKEALSDKSLAVRELAESYLNSVEVRDPAVRQFVFQHYAPIALDKQSPQRGEALAAIKFAYDPFADGSELNYRILSFIAERMGDPDPQVRSTAIQCIFSHLFGGGTDQPDPAKIRLANRVEVLRQLRRDASGGIVYTNGIHDNDAEKKAAKLLQTFDARQ